MHGGVSLKEQVKIFRGTQLKICIMNVASREINISDFHPLIATFMQRDYVFVCMYVHAVVSSYNRTHTYVYERLNTMQGCLIQNAKIRYLCSRWYNVFLNDKLLNE